jgi:hypothetical protein
MMSKRKRSNSKDHKEPRDEREEAGEETVGGHLTDDLEDSPFERMKQADPGPDPMLAIALQTCQLNTCES